MRLDEVVAKAKGKGSGPCIVCGKMTSGLDIIDPPEGVTGRSVLGAVRGEPWREFIHGEHSPCYSLEESMHFLTDGKEKYVWFPATGREQLFDISADRNELHDLAKDSDQATRVAFWRRRLVDFLGRRGDGFSDGKRLIERKERWPADVEHLLKRGEA